LPFKVFKMVPTSRTVLFYKIILLVAVTVVGSACEEQSDSPSLFRRVPPAQTGVDFSNDLTPSPKLNVVRWPYFYNGAGVAAGDLNGDGRVDLYFTSNQEANRLYLNEGDFRFREVTAAAGVEGTGDWSMGVTMVDVNGDGRLDLYVTVVHGYAQLDGHNQLYINQGTDENGVPQFTEKAEAYGLDHRSFGVQSVFFDYDGDGDLDMYQLNGFGNRPRQLPPSRLRNGSHERIGDQLYRNDGGDFVEVTDEAGIYSGKTGAGLGVTTSDFDQNGCPDLYVANDFYEHDYLYYNNCDGTFTQAIQEATGHVSYSSMGVDAADINNDGRMDLAVLDMLPHREEVLKTTEPSDDVQTYQGRREYGYHHQLDRNTLQLNQGSRRFSEIGLLAGVAATDWSWAPLFADFDADGRKDLFVTNGIYRRLNDLDYFDYALEEGRLQKLQQGDTPPYEELRKRMPHAPSPNFAFHNDGDLTFSDSSAAWGVDRSGFSNGAAYADLNNDGTLDLVVNNVNEPASIYENRADTLYDHHFLTVRLKGKGKNTQGVGAEVAVYQQGRRQTRRQQPTRGYLSSVDPRLNFGLGNRGVDSVRVLWPDGHVSTRSSVAPDQTITIRRSQARDTTSTNTPSSRSLGTTVPADRIGIDFRHDENTSYPSLQRRPFLPRSLSTEGPAMAVGDVTGNGLDDVFLGGAAGQPGALYVQQSTGRFRRADESQAVWDRDRKHEDVDAAFFDATGNGALDLYVVSGVQERKSDALLRDRLYLNDGTGTFRRASDRLPNGTDARGSVVAPGDFNGDGDVDLFVGTRAAVGGYGKAPSSYLFRNDGTGRFEDVTDEVAPGLRNVGMVTDGVWADLEGEGGLDLVVVGEWMPITVFKYRGDRLVNRTRSLGLAETTGWWTAIQAADLDGSGSPDLIAGNHGLNSRIRPRPGHPVRLYVNDFNEDGTTEPLLTRYSDGQNMLWARRDELLQEFPSLEQRFPTYESFGAKSINDIFSDREIQGSTVKKASVFSSVYVENQVDSAWTVTSLPSRAQLSPVYGILATDLTGEGHQDLMMGGNLYGVRPKQGRYDASLGTILKQGAEQKWHALPPPRTGLYLKGQIRSIRLLNSPGEEHRVLVARNDARPIVMYLQKR
jgi:hypothetical protein